MSSDMKTLKTYARPFLAELDRTLLEDNGIFAAVLDTNSFNICAVSSGLMGVRLVVSEEDYAEALRILNTSSSSE